jgi:light-regulated signal transduction histidine kinase (bacteriophytochrome)
MVSFIGNQSESQQNLNQANLLHRIVDRIRRSLELPEILNATAAEMRSILATDRVMIYRFDTDGSGEVIAESIRDQCLPSLIGLHFPADDIPPQARELFVKVRQRSIVSVPDQRIFLSQPDGAENPSDSVETAQVNKSSQRPVDPCHLEYLTSMGVQSSLVVPIVVQEELWGLLVSHHTQPQSISAAELELVQLVADQVAIAIAQATLLAKAREKAACEAHVNRIVALLHSEPSLDWQSVLAEIVTIFNGSGGRLFLLAPHLDRPNQLYTCGAQLPNIKTIQEIEQHRIWQTYFPTTATDLQSTSLWALTDLYAEAPTLSSLLNPKASAIRGLLVLPLHYHQEFFGYLSIFRDEIETEKLWAGQVDSDRRQTQPRKSFEVWRELKKGQVQSWTKLELELAEEIRHQFSLAFQQHQLYQQIHQLNLNLEKQVEERTAQLEQAFSQAIAQAQQLHQLTEQQNALSKVVANIRASLDLDTVFQIATREVRQLLNADRVGVFRFHPGSGFDDGEFVAEDVLPGYSSALAAQIHDHCFGEQYAAHYQRGRIQAVDDIHNAGLSDCHVQVLAQFEVKANLILPLLKNEALWGLLCIHQCAKPRHWQASEIEFATQIATQLGVALQQTELLSQTQQQAQQLAYTIQDLQQTQTSLIQTEKMSSLGQLVAGVAHEINNPVNFIYGNLTHAAEYTHDLLELLQLYQQHYPNPGVEIEEKAEEIDLDFLTEDLPKMLASMRIGADRIRQIVLSLRNFSRVDQAEKKPVDIHEGIDSTLLILQHRLKAKADLPGIELVKHYGNLPSVECYAGQLNQVFMNVLSNAIDALEAKVREQDRLGHEPRFIPTITIRTETLDSQQIAIHIADNGSGIPDSVRAKIFDPFFTTKAVGHGTGLGLSISYQIVVDKHGGKFECNSQPGQGTEFCIELPILQSKQVAIR